VSERMRRMKETENVRCPDVTMNLIKWQVEQATNRDTKTRRFVSGLEL